MSKEKIRKVVNGGKKMDKVRLKEEKEEKKRGKRGGEA